MKLMVTGGAGFIGSHLVRKLQDEGHQVVVVDNFSTSKRKVNSSHLSVYDVDLRDDKLDYVFSTERPEMIFHHAAQINVSDSMNNPEEDLSINVQGTANLLKMCKKHQVRKIVFASSAAVYGDPLSIPLKEEAPKKPMSFYGLSKWCAEQYLSMFCNLNNIEYTILRYSNVYGSGNQEQGEGGVVSVFLNQLIQEEQPTIYGSGLQTRDFIFVEDVVTANIKAIHAGNSHTINISSMKQTQIKDLLKLMCEITNKPYIPFHVEAKPGDIEHSVLDNRKAKQLLGWQPAFTLKLGLEETYKTRLRDATG
ncbi:MAG: NAD-dependent epimerase/dehydratase family protein [Bacillaceae bacterium]|nr:NAD-dependent epimerase/dehydratase family protein [Bacillaceae bacterium]